MQPDANPPAEVTLFLDDDAGLLVRGEPGAVDAVLAEILLPAELEAHRRAASHVTHVAAAGTSVGAFAVTAQEYLRPSAVSLEKLSRLGAQTDSFGALRGFVRDNGKFAGNLTFETVSFGAEQALALQTAAVTMALRTAIANVEAAVERVEGKVTDLQRRVGAKEVGDVVGVYRRLQRMVQATTTRGHLLDADWDAVAGAGLDLDRALESMRAYVTKTVNAIDPNARLPRREASVAELTDAEGVSGTLKLILVAGQALHLWEYLRLERVRQTDPDHAESALTEARSSLRTQRARNEELVVAAAARIELVRTIDPLEIHHFMAISGMETASNGALNELAAFARAARAPALSVAPDLSRPSLSESRAEARRKVLDAKDDVVEMVQLVGRATAAGAQRIRGRNRQPPTPPSG